MLSPYIAMAIGTGVTVGLALVVKHPTLVHDLRKIYMKKPSAPAADRRH